MEPQTATIIKPPTTICEPGCGHEAYDPQCSEYPTQPCCGYTVATDDYLSDDALYHLDNCHAIPKYEKTSSSWWRWHDGGRQHSEFRGTTGDCVTRALCIATDRDYEDVYYQLFELKQRWADTHRDKLARRIQHFGASPRNGVSQKVYGPVLKSQGFEWRACCLVGDRRRLHVIPQELREWHQETIGSDCLPDLDDYVFVLKLSGHVVTVRHGLLLDTYVDNRDGTRMVYGYWWKKV